MTIINKIQISDWQENLKVKYGLAVIFFLVIAVPFFYKLGAAPLRQYDEAFYALQAFEWAENGKYLKSYDANTHLLNTKPYLITWMQAASYKIFGYTNFALRFPVALCGWLTCILCWIYLDRIKATAAAYFSSFMLAVSFGFLDLHMSRSGDHDAPLIFFLMLNLFFSYLIIEEERRKPVYFIAWTLSLAAAVLTKSIIGFSFLPGILLYVVLTKKLRSIITLSQFYIAIVLLAALIAGYYLHREYATPGYLTSVWDDEIGRFYTKRRAINSEFSYFFKLLYYEQFFPWILLAPLAFFYFRQSSAIKNLLMLTGAAGLLFLLFISFSKVKLSWYNAPVLPVLSIYAGCGMAFLYQTGINYLSSARWFMYGAILFAGGYYYSIVFNRIEKQLKVIASERFDAALFYLKENYPNEKKISIVTSSGFNPQVKYLIALFNTKYDYDLRLKKSTSVFYPGEKVLISEPHTVNMFNKKVKGRLLQQPAETKLLEVVK